MPDIHVCGVFPAVIDTPIIEHGANYTGHAVEPPPFLYDSEDVAETIVCVALSPHDEVAVGWPARAGQIAYTVARGPVERLVDATAAAIRERARPMPNTYGSVVSPIAAGTSTGGGWRVRKRVPSAKTITAVAVAVTGTLLIYGLNGRRHRHRM